MLGRETQEEVEREGAWMVPFKKKQSAQSRNLSLESRLGGGKGPCLKCQNVARQIDSAQPVSIMQIDFATK